MAVRLHRGACCTSGHWVIYVFGAILLVTGIRMALRKDESIDREHNPEARCWPPADPALRRSPRGAAGQALPPFLVLLLVEFMVLVFAIDSIPPGPITEDPFIVYTENVMAILGLRSMYFLLAGAADSFVYLKYGLSLALVFVGAKMTADRRLQGAPSWPSLPA